MVRSRAYTAYPSWAAISRKPHATRNPFRAYYTTPTRERYCNLDLTSQQCPLASQSAQKIGTTIAPAGIGLLKQARVITLLPPL
ncbi:hypothetical protein PHAVU_008G148001 [Phaseolus vulgaris]